MKDEATTVDADGIISEVRDLVESYVKAEVITIEEPGTGVKALAIRAGNTVTVLPASSFNDYRERPLRLKGTATMLSLDSLIDHIVRSSDENSVVFADDTRTAPSLTAVYDYHEPSNSADGEVRAADASDIARHMLHRATFAFPLSDEWAAWLKSNGPSNAMSMADFADFVENRLPDVLFLADSDRLPEDLDRFIEALGGRATIATPNKLMELSRGLQVNEASVVQEIVNLQSGEGIVRFEATHSDATGGPLKVPAIFLIAIPVFRNGEFYRIAARLRYRKANGRVVFWYELWRTDRTFDHAFSEAVERVKTETGRPVLIGKPEA